MRPPATPEGVLRRAGVKEGASVVDPVVVVVVEVEEEGHMEGVGVGVPPCQEAEMDGVMVGV